MTAERFIGFVQLQAFAAQRLGWRPSDFWAATPNELVAASSDPQQSSACTPDDLAALLRRFPDS